MTVTPAEYDAWYETPRGHWTGNTELRLLTRWLQPRVGDELLDVGCGTGWFTRRLAAVAGVRVTGLDQDSASLRYASEHDKRSRYVQGDAQRLPFADASFDCVVSVAALGFVANWQAALGEMVRVTRGRFAIGVLNRASLLWRNKGRNGGIGAYRGVHWHSAAELRSAMRVLPVVDLRFCSAIFLPSGSRLAQVAEGLLSNAIGCGGLLAMTGKKLEVNKG